MGATLQPNTVQFCLKEITGTAKQQIEQNAFGSFI